MVTPDGGSHDRPAVIGPARAARGTVSGDFSIEILDPHPLWQAGDAVLLEYVEQQYRDGRTTGGGRSRCSRASQGRRAESSGGICRKPGCSGPDEDIEASEPRSVTDAQ